MPSLSARQLDVLLGDWRSSPLPAYSALADRIRLLMLDGRIVTGTRVPAERDLATHLGVSRTTVTAAYAELRDAGYLESVRGSGSVARLPGRAPVTIEPEGEEFLDFSKAAMPALPWLTDAASRAVEDLPAYLGDSGFDLIGIPPLREAIAELYRRRGLPTSPDQIMVTIGAQHAIALLSRTLIGRGDSALLEVPTYPHAVEAMRGAGARILPVSVTVEDGWDEAGLEQAIRRSSPAMGYLMPDFHNPTGRTMPASLRERTAQLAERHGTRLIVDETMASMAIDEVEPEPPFAAFGNAVTVGSVGKTVWGGIRVGWIRAEPALIQRLFRNRHAGDLGTPIIEQLVVTHLLADYDRIVETRRRQLRAGRDHMLGLLRSQFPEWKVPDVAGGLTAWVNLGAPVSSQLTLAARAEGLLITAGPRFGLDGAFERYLRVPFSYSPDEMDRAVAALSRAWGSLARTPIAQPEELSVVV
ncbi:PLP-dependent aminotransferase family protein [Salinibacterium sp. SYSU T00001]|uniref:MocR-like transcription factor YczR n=1 Tax=Homoserinimonas sedimenticola TaxID=2986805 RepID=UPI002236AA64|nr:PLP-dependent aminotransferase family protein [Salinibacterium sedimenticola]MCW4385500.1 PLP-dependent aminotransferase family protein [Salinibacterium sedimenticola]